LSINPEIPMTRLLTLCFTLLCLCQIVAADDGRPEQWYIVQMQNQRAGWMRERTVREGDVWRSETEMRLEIKRGSVALGIGISSEFVETTAGKPLSMSSTMKLGALPQTKSFRFLDDGVEVKESIGAAGAAGSNESVKKQPMPEGEWLTPMATERYFAKRIRAGDETITVRSIDPTNGLKPITSTHKLVERLPLEVIGRLVPAHKWNSTVDLYPNITTTTCTDERGRPLRSEVDIGGIKLTIILADKDLALAKLDAPELLVATMIHPDKPINKPRDLKRAVYLVESTGETLTDIPSLGAQTFERLNGKSGRLTIDLSRRSLAAEGDAKDPRYTDCTTMITCSDEGVKSLIDLAFPKTDKAADIPKSKTARAEALRKMVYQYISKKSLDVGFASAAEVAATRNGDCSEHGVLLCAVLRADGIPARVVAGLVYVDTFAGQDKVFGYHMWTQALLPTEGGNHWVDLDGAISADSPFDATHIALTTSSLSDEDMTNSLVQMVPLLGTLKLKVETVE